MSAPERIWLTTGQSKDPTECTLSHANTDGHVGVEYIRADFSADQIAILEARIEELCDSWRTEIRAHQDGCPASFSNCVPDDCACGLTELREAEIRAIKQLIGESR